MKLLQTISYANAPEIGVQFATIEQDEQGTHVYLHFTELKYNYTTQQNETVPYLYHAWATDQARHTSADILNCAKELLAKYACRAKYFGPMVYTVVDAPAEQITKAELVAATVGALAAALQDEPAAPTTATTSTPEVHTVTPEPFTYARIATPLQFLQTLAAGPYAWPGGYPLFFVMQDGGALSFEAAAEQQEEILDAFQEEYSRSGWAVAGCEINYEDDDLYCDHTGKKIGSAYSVD